MYSNDGAVLGISTAMLPMTGAALWPSHTLFFVGMSFVLVGTLFLVFKRRNRRA